MVDMQAQEEAWMREGGGSERSFKGEMSIIDELYMR